MRLLKTIDENILKWFLGIFLFFIPLYMKFPLRNVTFTYISIRLDDFVAILIIAIFVVQLLRRKISFQNLPFKKYFGLYWLILFAALASGIYLTQTIDYTSIGFLHAARRVQYMMLFFIAFASVRSVKDFKFFMYIFLMSLLIVNIYGLGQRLYGFPAISTMNPEFAKGRVLYLTPEARLSSTFAGHYDLGAYLVLLFPLMWGLYFAHEKFILSLREKMFILSAAVLPVLVNVTTVAWLAFGFSSLDLVQIILTTRLFLFILLLTTISATLLLSLKGQIQRWAILGIIILSVMVLVGTASRTSSIAYLVSISGFLLFFKEFRYLIFVLIFSLTLTAFDTDLVQRWARTIQVKQIIINRKTGEQVVVQKIRPDELPAGTAFVGEGSALDTKASALLKQELINKATMSGSASSAADYQTYSAVAGDISISTRLQVSWPRAIKAFLRNPFLGTGPSSITESSDGDYFRMIGETGLLGLVSFFMIFVVLGKFLFDKLRLLRGNAKILVYAVVFGVMGLFINATLIDVFEASKVAYTLWAILGLCIALVHLDKTELEKLS